MNLKRIITPTTMFGETNRQLNNHINSNISPSEKETSTIGIVSEVHPTKACFVKCYSATDKSVIAGNKYVRLNHSAEEIAERWGTVRVGFRVQVKQIGPNGLLGCSAIIIGTEGEDQEEDKVENRSEKGLYAIFSPGISIG